mgnify:CR=1 FL=1
MEAKEFNKLLNNADCNQHSFIKIYQEYYSKIVLHISVKFDASIAQDIAHEFFCKIINGQIKNNENINCPTAWIFRICDNLAINVYKREARYVSLSDFDFTDNIQDIDTILDIKKVLDNLDEFESKIIYFHFFEGYSLKEIAFILNTKYDNLRKKYSTILKKLRKNKSLFPN